MGRPCWLLWQIATAWRLVLLVEAALGSSWPEHWWQWVRLLAPVSAFLPGALRACVSAPQPGQAAGWASAVLLMALQEEQALGCPLPVLSPRALSPVCLAAAHLQKLGLNCFYDNAQLAAWADVLFLCCLPSHTPSICSVVRPAIRKPCIVYSLITAVPLPR